MDAVVEMPPTMAVKQLIQIHFSGVGEGRMSDVMAQGDGFDQVQIQIQRLANGSGDPGDQLDMETPAGDVIIADQGKNLRLIAVTVIIWAVHDLVDVMDIGRTPDAGLILSHGTATEYSGIVRTHPGEGSVLSVKLDSLRHTCGKGFVIRHRLHLVS